MVRLALVPVLFVGVVGCEANGGDEGLFVTKNVAPQGTTCVFTGDESEPFFSHGAVTTVLGSVPYLFTAQIKSRISALDTETDQKTVITSGADVDISFADSSISVDDDLLTHFQAPFSAPIPPNGGIADATFTLLQSKLIDEIAAQNAAAAEFDVEVIAEFTVRGTMSGEDVSSQKFRYGITIGNNLIVHNVGDPTMMGKCPAQTGITIRTGNPCNIAQDEDVDCCVAGGQLQCPASL
jgi:hypothetical protein